MGIDTAEGDASTEADLLLLLSHDATPDVASSHALDSPMVGTEEGARPASGRTILKEIGNFVKCWLGGDMRG